MNNRRFSLLFFIISLFACVQPVAAMEQEREDVNADVELLQLPDELLEQIVLFSLVVDSSYSCRLDRDLDEKAPCKCWQKGECKTFLVRLGRNFLVFRLLCRRFNSIVEGFYRKFFNGVFVNKTKVVFHDCLPLILEGINKGFFFDAIEKEPFRRLISVYAAMEGSLQNRFLDRLRECICERLDKIAGNRSIGGGFERQSAFGWVFALCSLNIVEYVEDNHASLIDPDVFGEAFRFAGALGSTESLCSILFKKDCSFISETLVIVATQVDYVLARRCLERLKGLGEFSKKKVQEVFFLIREKTRSMCLKRELYDNFLTGYLKQEIEQFSKKQ